MGRRLFDEESFDLADLVGADGYQGITRKEICQYCMAAPAHAMVFVERVRANGRNYFITDKNSFTRCQAWPENNISVMQQQSL